MRLTTWHRVWLEAGIPLIETASMAISRNKEGCVNGWNVLWPRLISWRTWPRKCTASNRDGSKQQAQRIWKVTSKTSLWGWGGWREAIDHSSVSGPMEQGMGSGKCPQQRFHRAMMADSAHATLQVREGNQITIGRGSIVRLHRGSLQDSQDERGLQR